MQKKSMFKRFIGSMAGKLLIILIVAILITMVIGSGVLSGDKPLSAMFTDGFMASNNLRGVLSSIVIQCIMLCGISCILIGGNIDLSVAAQAALSTMIFGWFCENTQLPWGLIVLIVLVIAACFGLINTFLVTKMNFPAFIATIGMASIYKGFCNIITGNYSVTIARAGFNNLSVGSIGIFPYLFLFAVLLIIVFQLVLSKTRFGRNIFASGGNPNAARLAGINTKRTVMSLFIINSVMAAIGGLLWTSQTHIANPTAITSKAPDMTVISAVILGGVSFTGGAGNLGGPFIALIFINVIDNMLKIMKINDYWSIVIQGLLLAVALIFDYVNTERARKAMLAEKH